MMTERDAGDEWEFPFFISLLKDDDGTLGICSKDAGMPEMNGNFLQG